MNVQWQLRQVMTAWIENGRRRDHVEVLVSEHSGTRVCEWPVRDVLQRLRGDETPVPEPLLERLDLAPDTTHAQLVADLLEELGHEAPAHA